VFLDADRVNFQKEGFQRAEMLAGLAQVLPKNVWQYVVQVPRLAEFGRVFVLQGGTQRNLAAVKAQVDYIRPRVPDAKIVVHPHCGEAGAIGAAMETLRVVRRTGALSTVHRLRAGDSPRVHRQKRREHDLPLLPERLLPHVHRHQDARRPHEPLHQRLLVREGHRREQGGAQELQRERNVTRKQFPNLVD
jgi:hypothetical protein